MWASLSESSKSWFKQTLFYIDMLAKRLGCIFSRRTSPPSLVVPAEINVHTASKQVQQYQAHSFFRICVGKSVQVVQALRMKTSPYQNWFWTFVFIPFFAYVLWILNVQNMSFASLTHPNHVHTSASRGTFSSLSFSGRTAISLKLQLGQQHCLEWRRRCQNRRTGGKYVSVSTLQKLRHETWTWLKIVSPQILTCSNSFPLFILAVFAIHTELCLHFFAFLGEPRHIERHDAGRCLKGMAHSKPSWTC